MLITAMQDEQARTANGAKTYSTSKNKVLDLFFAIGASRGQDITQLVLGAAEEDPELTAKVLLWARDVRGGAGERQLFRDSVAKLNDPYLIAQVLQKVPEVGRWDDLLVFLGTPQEPVVLDLLRQGLASENPLCAKWLPRPNKELCKRHKLWRKLGFLSPGAYRKRLARLTRVVETPMCDKEWSSIDFEKLTSLNHKRYASAFERNAPHYGEYVQRLTEGNAKVNAGAVYPYDVIELLNRGRNDLANAMWGSLPDFLEGNNERILPLVDVSGSMGCPAGDSKLTCMDVAISLGLYLSERAKGPFKDSFMTFSAKPTIQTVKGSLQGRYRGIYRSGWGFSTDLGANFELLLNTAVNKKVPKSEMPTMLIILSDMEFDDYDVSKPDQTAMKAIKARYKKAGYKIPKLVFWNLNARPGNVPVRAHSKSMAAVSGFSPSIMKSLLSGKDFSPEAIMLETLSDPRYSLG